MSYINKDHVVCFVKFINPFVPNLPFLYPLKTSENRIGVEKGYTGNEWVNERAKHEKNEKVMVSSSTRQVFWFLNQSGLSFIF